MGSKQFLLRQVIRQVICLSYKAWAYGAPLQIFDYATSLLGKKKYLYLGKKKVPSVPVFANQNKSEEDFTFYHKKRQQMKIVFSICLARSY